MSTCRGPIKAGIFDMDGVLLDSEPLHHQAVNMILAAEGRAGLTLAEYRPYLGTTDEHTWTDLINRRRLEEPLTFYLERFDDVIVEQYRRHSTITPGAQDLLDGLKASGLALAVASSSRRTWVETCLQSLQIRHYFDVIVGGDMVVHGKPDPAIYLLAAQLLGDVTGRVLRHRGLTARHHGGGGGRDADHHGRHAVHARSSNERGARPRAFAPRSRPLALRISGRPLRLRCVPEGRAATRQ